MNRLACRAVSRLSRCLPFHRIALPTCRTRFGPAACTVPSRASFFFQASTTNSNDVDELAQELLLAKAAINNVELEKAKQDLQRLSGKVEDFSGTSFEAEAQPQRQRDLFVESQLLLADLYGSTMVFDEAQQVLESLSVEYQACAAKVPDAVLAEHADQMAKILHRLIMCLFTRSEDVPISVSALQGIAQKFALFMPAADANSADVVNFYALLARAHVFAQDLNGAREVLDKHLLTSERDNDASTMSQWRLLEGQHCLAVFDINVGDSDSATRRLQNVREGAKALMESTSTDDDAHEILANLFATVTEKLCNVAFVNERFEAAEWLLREAIVELAQLKGGEACMRVARVKHTLAGTLHHLQRGEDLVHTAEDLLETCPTNNLEASSFLANVGDMVSSLPGNLDLCSRLLRTALETRNRVIPLSKLDLERARIQTSLGAVLNIKQEFSEALPLLQNGLDAMRQVLGGKHFQLAPVLHNLGLVCKNTGDNEAAVQHLEKALLISEADEMQNQRVAIILGHLGQVHEALGHHSEAESFIERAVAAKRQVMPKDPQLALDLQNLAAMKQRSRDLTSAAALFREAVEILSERFGEHHIHVACVRHLLANVLLGDQQYEESVRLFELALPVLESNSIVVPKHQLIPLLKQYSQLLRIVNRHDDANSVSRRVKDMIETMKS